MYSATCIAQIQDKHNMVQKIKENVTQTKINLYLPIWQLVYTKIDNFTQLK